MPTRPRIELWMLAFVFAVRKVGLEACEGGINGNRLPVVDLTVNMATNPKRLLSSKLSETNGGIGRTSPRILTSNVAPGAKRFSGRSSLLRTCSFRRRRECAAAE